MSNTLIEREPRFAVALCMHYFNAHFEEQRVQVLVDGVSTNPTVAWAVCLLADGDWEALGAWPGAACGPAFWQGVWDDIDPRGVDKISWVCTSDPDVCALCPGIRVLPPFRSVLGQKYVPPGSIVGVLRAEARCLVREASGVRAARVALERLLLRAGAGSASLLSPDWPEVLEQFRPFYALRPHRRAVVRAGDEYLQQLGHRLCRAVARHGPFTDLAAAVSFVAQTLSREQLRLMYPWLSRTALPALGLGRPVSSGLAAPGP